MDEIDRSLINLPLISLPKVVYRDRNREISEVKAIFGEFYKDYLVSYSGRRSGILVVHEQSVLMVRQFRLLINDVSWEIPGGSIDEGEEPQEAAIRECLEETGVLCDQVDPLLFFHPGMDTTNNPTHIFYSKSFTKLEKPLPNPREILDSSWLELDQCMDMIGSGLIVDSLTLIALLMYKHFKNAGNTQ